MWNLIANCTKERIRSVLALAVLSLLSAAATAQSKANELFSSPDAACQALLAAVQGGNEHEIAKVLGSNEEFISSGDSAQDQQDRELFIEKYQQMHRLVQEEAGQVVLYIGAENWPFPVPLASKSGKWFFDTDAGAEEVVFRRVGENEAAVIQLCRRLARGTENARDLIPTIINTGGRSEATESITPLEGYYFRMLRPHVSSPTAAIAIAYPAEYRSSGVETFVVTRNGDVYEKDLGPQTNARVTALIQFSPGRAWKRIH